MIPTQLRQIVGMKNAFEKITGIVDPNNNNFEILHNSKHAGTLASIARDDNSKQRITDLNARQAQEWMSKDHILHANTLNSGNRLVQTLDKDAEIVTRTNTAINNVGGFHTNTAFNKFRKIASFSNLSGVKERLNNLADNLPEGKIFDKIKTHLKPQNRLYRLFNKPRDDFRNLLSQAEQVYNLPKETIEILKIAVDLKKDVEKSDRILFREDDKNNISADISKKLNYLNNRILNSKDSILSKTLKHETLTMCASGKDRTGLAEHDQSAGVIANKLNMKIEDVDKQLLRSGHTAGQAGGVHAGGTTIGCYGTLPVTSQGFPEIRKDILQPIMEPTAPNNKIKILKKSQVINEPIEQKSAIETPNMLNDEIYNTTPTNAIKKIERVESPKSPLDKKELPEPVMRELTEALKRGSLSSSDPNVSSSKISPTYTPNKPRERSSSAHK